VYNKDAELLFPLRVIPSLSDARGGNWQGLLDRVMEGTEPPLDRYAVVLMMARLARCETCRADSYRAYKGCTYCSWQALKRFPGSDSELVSLFKEARQEIELYISENQLQLG
jgi:hypothetical protein